ncbi:hypothetical protein AAIA72_10405 [Hahella sp. SMD15-11]|uniref:Uncharacterized protein n=1 Tax=Thermohahella caldifontis TaxID=3142973 RepID=A0AB39UTA1_9GAMM
MLRRVPFFLAMSLVWLLGLLSAGQSAASVQLSACPDDADRAFACAPGPQARQPGLVPGLVGICAALPDSETDEISGILQAEPAYPAVPARCRSQRVPAQPRLAGRFSPRQPQAPPR